MTLQNGWGGAAWKNDRRQLMSYASLREKPAVLQCRASVRVRAPGEHRGSGLTDSAVDSCAG